MRKFAGKKFFALSMAAAMTISLAGCGNGTEDEIPTPGPESTPKPTTAPAATDAPSTPDDSNNPAPTNEPVAAADTYTYDIATLTFPDNWNPHTYQTNTATDILGYISAGFYNFDFNENKDGYALVTDMLSKDVEDVTADYIGKYGLAAGDKARAWKLTIRDDIKWEDGTIVTAQDFVRSAELLLNPLAKNYRADSFYTGSLSLVNARNYLYQGEHAYASPVVNVDTEEGYISMSDLIADENGALTAADGKEIAASIFGGTNWSGTSLEVYHEKNTPLFMVDDVDVYTTFIEPNANEKGYVTLTKEVLDALNVFIARAHNHETIEEYFAAEGEYAYQEWCEFCYYGEDYPETPFSDVGIFALSDTEFVLVLETPLEGFYLHYALTDSWLVNEQMYLSCEKVIDGVYTNSYCTTAATTISYGPYKLATFQADKEFTLDRNEYYYGLKEGQYQTTTIREVCVSEPATRLEMFLSGELDSYGLSADDMETYASSDHTYYTTTPSTYFVALNPNLSALTSAQEALGSGYNKTILTVKEFRQALSFSLDRAAFARACVPTNNPAFGIFSNQIISDPENGTAYRTEEKAKWVLAKFWGLADEIGAGKMYETVDDAIDSITGYSLAQGKELFNKAYDIAIANGLMKEGDMIQIKIGIPGTSASYVKGYEFLSNCYKEAVVGTALEGKLDFVVDDTIADSFGPSLRNNLVDMLFLVGWSGSALDPYNLIGAYTQQQYRYDQCWDTSRESLTVTIDGVDYTASVLDWSDSLEGNEITITAADGTAKTFSAGSAGTDPAVRFDILVALEEAVLNTYDMIPLVDASSAGLKGMQVQYGSEEYFYGIGRGGVQYMTYNYTDAEWAEFVSSQGGKLNYN